MGHRSMASPAVAAEAALVRGARTGLTPTQVKATILASGDAKPPLMVSHDAGLTWRDAGRGLPPGFAVAISPDDPDVVLYGARNRLYLSRDGGRFWSGLAPELPEITAVAF